MKKLILLLTFISVLIGIILSLNSKPNFVETTSQNASLTVKPQASEVQQNTGKVLSVMPQEYKEK